MDAPHPQVIQLLERAARSPLPLYHTVPPHVARRLYRDTRSLVAPAAPEVSEVRLMVIAKAVAVRAYRPAGAARTEVLPALVFFHGGGYVIGDLDTHDVLCRQLANGARCAVFSVDYRLAPEDPFPAALEDCVAATRYVCAQAKAFGVDADRIAVGGDSAGGNLATVVALDARDAGAPGRLARLARVAPVGGKPGGAAPGVRAHRRVRSPGGRGPGLCRAPGQGERRSGLPPVSRHD